MFGIQVRLTLLFVVIVTLVLSISGAYTQHSLGRKLEQGDLLLRQGVLTRLKTSLPSALWRRDRAKVDSILAAEMLPPELVAIRVYDAANGLFAGMARAAEGSVLPISADLALGTPGAGAGTAASLRVGKVVVDFSRAPTDAALATQLRHKVLEVLLLDLILVAALALSLRMVFQPLRQLRDGLVDLATRGSDEVEELAENRRDELGDVIRGFNALQRKVKSIIARMGEAEDAARRSEQAGAQAMRDLRQAQESLIQSERLASLGSLVAGVAHEINTPVGIALTSASVLKEATDALQGALAGGAIRKADLLGYLDTATESARLILNNTARAAQLIHSFKQIAVDQVSEVRRRFELREYLEEIVASLQPALKKTRIRVSIDCPAEIVLDSYPGALAQVITNLTLNCVEHAFDAHTGGSIDIGATQDGEWIEMSVRDDGKGIAPELLDKVFDPFVTTRRGQGGTGLGLNIVFNLVAQRFGGSIGVSSTPGQGARFVLRIPGVAPQQEALA